ncbi:MAG: hemolysin III family protein [Pseudomonadota bacterium]
MKLKLQTTFEEIPNSVIHGIGFLLSIAALVLMVVFSVKNGNAWHVVSSSIFGSTLIILYLSSTLYHAFFHKKTKAVFRLMDHIVIYLLIAGTYTPFALCVIQGGFGWTLFGLEWGLAIIGIVFKSITKYKYDFYATLGYALMGWLVIIAIGPLFINLSFMGILWLVLGGLSYTIGIIFYFFDTKVKYFHFYWHVFVLGGSICHFFAFFFHVIP